MLALNNVCSILNSLLWSPLLTHITYTKQITVSFDSLQCSRGIYCGWYYSMPTSFTVSTICWIKQLLLLLQKTCANKRRNFWKEERVYVCERKRLKEFDKRHVHHDVCSKFDASNLFIWSIWITHQFRVHKLKFFPKKNKCIQKANDCCCFYSNNWTLLFYIWLRLDDE